MNDDVPVLSNGTETSDAAALQLELSGMKSVKQRFAMILIAQSREDGMTVGELREAKGSRWHHGSTSGLLSTLHSRDRLAALSEPRGGQTVYVLPEFVNGRETRPYHRQAGEKLRHDEGTLTKVYDALATVGVIDQEAMDVVHEMQNAGILFRERA